jgi:hypothetical protein
VLEHGQHLRGFRLCGVRSLANRVRRGGPVLAVLACIGVTAACGSGAARAPLAGGTPAASRTAVATRSATPTGAGPTGAGPTGAGGVKRADLLNGVWCTGRDCVAVGGYYYGSAAEHTLVETWTGSTWQVEPSPDTARYSSLQAVSCAAATGCVAVGSPVLAWNGARWQVTMPASTLTAVSCAPGDFCMAVGLNARGAPSYALWNGRAWRTGPMVAPPQPVQATSVSGVSCTAAAQCVAVGDYSYGATAQPSAGTFRDRILAESWNGSSWRLLPTVNVGPVDRLTAVSCTSPDGCTAVGTSAQQFPLAEHWNGNRWQVQPVPAPGRIGYTQLTAVSCGPAPSCMAVGDYQGVPIAEAWDGSNWRLQPLPDPPDDHYSADLTSVSCVSAAACVAVGVSGNAQSYAELYQAGRWRLMSTQNPV